MKLLKIGNHIIFEWADVLHLASVTNNQFNEDAPIGLIIKSSENKDYIDRIITLRPDDIEMVFENKQDILSFDFEDYPELKI